MKILVAGGGAFGKEHLRTLSGIAGVTLAVAESRAEELDRIGALFPIAMSDQDAAALLDRFAPDGIVIATPVAAHAPLAFTALARNIPVLVEKPVAPDAATMRQLCDAVGRSRSFLQPGHILRFSAPHRQLHDIVAQGEIGELLRITSRRYRDSSHAERYRDIDPVFTTMIHDIDLALWFDGGAATEVRATRLPRGEYRSLTVADVMSSRGIAWQLSLAWLHPSFDCPPDRVELVGTLGSVEFEAGSGIDLYTREGHRHLPHDGGDDPLRTELDAFLAGIRAGRLLAPVTPEDALAGLLVAESIVRKFCLLIVDAHIHLFRNGYTGFAGPSPLGGQSDVDAYEQLARRNGVDAALVVCYEEQIDVSNNVFVRELARSRPWMSSVAYLSSRDDPTAVHINGLLAAGHIGIALHLPDAAAVERVEQWPRDLWDRLARARALVSLNARPEAIARLAPLVENAPGCAFLFSHLGLPGRADHLLSAAEATARLAPLLRLAPLANVAVKISGLYAVDPAPPHAAARPFIDVLLQRFPASRLHWGSDFSPVLEFSGFEQTLAAVMLADCDAGDRRLIMGDALAARLFVAQQAVPVRKA